jgi:hypothetical protein
VFKAKGVVLFCKPEEATIDMGHSYVVETDFALGDIEEGLGS